MERNSALNFDAAKVPSPCYLIDRGLLRRNVELLADVQKRCGAKILLAQKAFATWGLYGEIKGSLAGTAASSLNEAKLGREEFGGEVHYCAPGIRADEIDELCGLCDHIVFNSVGQLERFEGNVAKAGRDIEVGLRINPRHSEVETAIYDPCGEGSRFGVTIDKFDSAVLDKIDGLHFHNLCELNSDALERTLAAVEEQFGEYLGKVKWVNFGGGHHITRADYDVDLLCELVRGFAERYGVQVYLEPGEAVALNTGYLVSTVLDVVRNDMDIAIMDTSAATHMPDVLEMPYRPEIEGAGKAGDFEYCYRLAGPSCLAGDVIGEYSFAEPLKIGDRIVFHDMAHYTMVKTNMFNGINLPSIVFYEPGDDSYLVQREFDYLDFKSRLS